jgi:polyketide synthase PksM/rhizoxin synthesis polyketide synthase/nonribosomal peptide synthetase RhiB
MTANEAETGVDGVAIIGMAARLPGAVDVDAYWDNLTKGVSAIRKATDDELLAAGFTSADIANPNLVRAFGWLDGVANFDAQFFGYPPARAQGLDPQQRLLLEVAWHALEHAGYASGTHGGSIGTYLSITQSTYQPEGQSDLADSFFALTSRDKDYAASRIAYKLDLTGPSLMIQSASSGSLAAVHAAVEALLSGQCDMALAGGCSISLPQGAYRHAPGLMLSASGTCRAFDAGADGAVPGNGLGIVVLKPVAQAMADGDTIYAVIRGSALNNDGAQKTDYLAPSVRGQARVVGEALAVADVDPATIGYIETHGTGTLIGDPIEIRALSQVFSRDAFGTRHCAIGSAKPSIGHLHVASGVAGLIKAALAVYHGVIPPSLNFSVENPEAQLASTPFYVNTALADWPLDGPRRAGVSAFGLGGTNVHVVLEQAPRPPSRQEVLPVVVIAISAKTKAALDRARRSLADYLRATPSASLLDVAWTLAAGRHPFAHRIAVLCTDHASAIAALEGAGSVPVGAAGAMADAARAWLAGDAVDWKPLFADARPRRIPLPLYPFDAVRHWSSAERPVQDAAFAAAPERTIEADLLPWLQRQVGDILRQDPAELDPETTYEAFGIDSLLVNTITQALQKRFPKLRATVLFEYNTLRSLAGHLAAFEPIPARASSRPSAEDVDGIAVIGMAGRYPGATDLAEFWNNLRQGRASISEVPADRWDWREHVDPDRKDRSYTRWGGFVADADKFDPLFFGISPREAKFLDPQQRLVLETAWSAIENAGHTRQSLKASAEDAGDVGVFVGAMHNAYRLLAMDAVASGQLVQSNHWSIANRVSYHFDFTGPSLVVDTACSASLTAVHLACESLRRGECGAALVAGVSLILHPQQPLELCRAGMVSKGGSCHAFGEAADGFVQGEGVGVVVLKPLSAAVADGDRILAVIRGSAMNAGGKTSGYTVPNPRAQAAVVEAALKQAKLSAGSISYVECHGTGTSLGDPIEIAGLTDAFTRVGGAGFRCSIGSVKSNIGHLESAAGIAGLTKVVLQLGNRVLVPSLHSTPANPRIDFGDGALRVQRTTTPWDGAAGAPLRAGVSSFGAGGANVHVILEQAPAPAATVPLSGPFLVVLSARTPEQLLVVAADLRRWLASEAADMSDVAYTLAVGREAMEARVAFVAADMAELLRQLTDMVYVPPTVRTDATAVEPALARWDLHTVGELWCAGVAIDWSRLYPARTRRRLSLPTYPFLRERHWLPDVAPAATGGSSLLGAAVPTLAAEARWQVPLHADQAVMAQHRVAGHPTLPGVATIELAVQAAIRLGMGHQVRIRDLAWLRPLSNHSDGDAEFVMRASEGAVRFELVHDTRTISAGTIQPVSHEAHLSEPASSIDQRSGDALYEQLEARGLRYGPAFRTIETFGVHGPKAVAVARSRGTFGDCHLNLGLMDAALQLTAALMDDRLDGLPLPFAVESVTIFSPPQAVCRLMAERLDDGTEPGVVRFNAMISDMDGVPCVIMHGLAGRVTPKQAAPIPPFYQPVWVDAPNAASIVPDARPMVIVSDTDPLKGALKTALPNGRFVRDALPGDHDALLMLHVVFSCVDEPATVDRLFRTLQALARRTDVTPVVVTVLSLRPDAQPCPWSAAAIGLARVAAHEFPTWTVRCIEIASPSAVPAALADPGDNLGREISLRAERRFVRALQPVDLAIRPSIIRRDGVFVILGGTGGIGLELAVHLATRYRAKVALIGRSRPDAMREARIATLNGSIAFFAADARIPAEMQEAIAKVRTRFGRIHGAVHSAIVMEDQAFGRMSDAAFHAALDVKTLGTINFVDALVGEPLEWLALFSSANSFAANAGQANYVAGCAFKDAYADIAQARLGCKVRVINWGFWGDVGRVASPAYRALLDRRGVKPIGTAEGLAAFEQALAADRPQVMVLRADEQVLRQLGVIQASPPSDPVDRALAEHAELDHLTRRALSCWVATHRLQPSDIAPRHRQVFNALSEMIGRGPSLPLSLAETVAEERRFVQDHPDLAPHVTLLRQCIDRLADVLRGDVLATDVLFPGSSMALVEGIYRGDRLTSHCNELVAKSVVDAVRGHGGAKVRVLEVGAGTGGTSAAVLAALARTGLDLEYVYTDVSKAFALHGERQFGAQYDFVRFGVLDLNRDPEHQGYEDQDYDVILGANVVHVTPDLRITLERLRRLLKPGGAVVLYEMTALPDFATATFGLLDGWWSFADARLPHGPLLGASDWSGLFQSLGFSDVALLGIGGGCPEAFRHTVISACLAAARGIMKEADKSHGGLIGTIREVVADTLQMRPEQLLPDRNFADYGADSIISVELIGALNVRFNITLKPTILFSHPTVERLADHLASHHAVRVEAVAQAEAPVTQPEPPQRAARERAGAWMDDIAIIGMAGRFPGANSIDAFWNNIVGGVDSVGPVPRSRWDHQSVYDADPSAPGRTQCPAGGFLDDVESFDPLFFNISPSEATLMDPQQRLFLQEAWHALEDAGYGGPHPSHDRCGVFVGTVAGDYDSLLRQAGRLPDAQRFMGNAASMLAARIAYRLDLHGPCLSVDTACSSSLVALHLACESLLRGESDMALVGGVAVLTTPDFYLAASNAGMLSPTGRCHTLDASADGFVPGEAVAAIVLKRRTDAERDGDTIHALVKGAATNQDGASNGITAPNGSAQTALERVVYDRFQIDPATIGYVELHGTGTKLGDPIEMEALKAAFAGRRQNCAVGSVKANIGHTLPAAGLVGVIKLALTLRHRTIPPAVHFQRLNDHIDLIDSPFTIPNTARAWIETRPRRGAVSSFGFSGTNVHAVLEEAPVVNTTARTPGRQHLAVFSAVSAEALVRVLGQMIAWLGVKPDSATIEDVCGTLARGRSHLKSRAAFVVTDLADLEAALRNAHGAEAAWSGTVGALRQSYLSGEDVRWDSLYPDGSFGRISLPAYPFDARRCWPVSIQPLANGSGVLEKVANGPLDIFNAVIQDLGAVT